MGFSDDNKRRRESKIPVSIYYKRRTESDELNEFHLMNGPKEEVEGAARPVEDMEEDELETMITVDDNEEEFEPEHELVLANELVTSNITEDQLKTLFDLMKCEHCKFIPYPNCRFICDSGHHYCGACGKKRISQRRGICGKELTEVVTNFKIENAHGDFTEPVINGLPAEAKQVLLGDDTRHTSFCQGNLKKYPPDPLFMAVFNSTKMYCPMNKLECCNEVVTGESYEAHRSSCLKKLNLRLGIDSD